ncbi:MAG: HAD family hydrolase [Clostridiales bacterium]
MNNKFKNTDSLIFDLDGTLWDAVSGVTTAWNIAIKKFNLNMILTENDVRGIMGLTAQGIKEKLFPNLHKNAQDELFTQCSKEEQIYLNANGAKIYPKVKETLAQLSLSMPLFIVSNCGHGYIEAFLDYYNLRPYIKDFEYFTRTGMEKGENIKLIIDRNNLKHPIYIGDTMGDYKGAKYADIPFIFAAYGFGTMETTEKTITNFADLKTLFNTQSPN